VGGDVEECLGFGGKGRCFADNLETCHVRNQGFRLRRLELRHKFVDGEQLVCRVSRQKVGLVQRDIWPSQSSDVREAVVADSRHVASSKPDSPSTSAMEASLGTPRIVKAITISKPDSPSTSAMKASLGNPRTVKAVSLQPRAGVEHKRFPQDHEREHERQPGHPGVGLPPEIG
jgi:hypothetical protein